MHPSNIVFEMIPISSFIFKLRKFFHMFYKTMVELMKMITKTPKYLNFLRISMKGMILIDNFLVFVQKKLMLYDIFFVIKMFEFQN